MVGVYPLCGVFYNSGVDSSAGEQRPVAKLTLTYTVKAGGDMVVGDGGDGGPLL
ncbi:MAG: hypothetical protein QNK32_06965 [Porticoccus sp.]|nr:hypothetical protein [Porticoccus sp.]